MPWKIIETAWAEQVIAWAKVRVLQLLRHGPVSRQATLNKVVSLLAQPLSWYAQLRLENKKYVSGYQDGP